MQGGSQIVGMRLKFERVLKYLVFCQMVIRPQLITRDTRDDRRRAAAEPACQRNLVFERYPNRGKLVCAPLCNASRHAQYQIIGSDRNEIGAGAVWLDLKFRGIFDRHVQVSVQRETQSIKTGAEIG